MSEKKNNGADNQSINAQSSDNILRNTPHESQAAGDSAELSDNKSRTIETASKKGFIWPWKKKSNDGTKKPRKPWSNKKKVIVSVVAAVMAVIIGFGSYAYSIWANPMGQFDKISQQVTPKPAATQAPDGSEGPEEPTPTIDPYEALAANADFGLLDNIVNIMLIGVDHAEERDNWGGKGAFHSDVMLVLSVNTDTNEVSMISLPRDTYAKIPGVDGIYKLNASIDCGGGWPTEGGFQKVCEAASWMLGDIPVQYYYAVDMNAVKGLVEAIGGVDFDLDIDFKMAGRYYKAGLQHMNGQAVLDYLRVRKPKDILSAGGTGDLNRVDRQKRMLVAIFEKLKATDLLATIPDLLSAFDGNLYTNTTIAQTAGLAAYAYKNISPEDISMYSMGGHYQDIFGWNFVITDQKARVELIKKVYGVDVPQYKDYTSSAANKLWENMEAKDIQKKAKPVLKQVKAILDADAALPPYPTPTPMPTPTPAAPATPPVDTATPPVDTQAMLAFKPINKGNQVVTFDEVPNPANYRKYGDDIWALYNKTVDEVNRLTSIKSTDELKAANDQSRLDIQTLCAMFSIKVPNWDVDYEKAVNEIYVDFR